MVVNVRGREQHGIVEPGDAYEQVRDQIAARLLELRGPVGETIVARVHRREDLFHGPELAKVPDLLVEFDQYAWLGKGNLKSRSESLWDEIEIEGGSEHSYVGSHRHEGIVVLSGPAVAPGAPVGASSSTSRRRSSTSSASRSRPTSRPDPRGSPDRGLDERASYDDETRRPRSHPSAPSSRRRAPREVERRLRGLGYLE